MKNSSNTKYNHLIYSNLYFTVVICLLTLSQVECGFLLSDPGYTSCVYLSRAQTGLKDGSAKRGTTQVTRALTPWPF